MKQRWEADGMRFNEQGRKNERAMMHDNIYGGDEAFRHDGIGSRIAAV